VQFERSGLSRPRHLKGLSVTCFSLGRPVRGQPQIAFHAVQFSRDMTLTGVRFATESRVRTGLPAGGSEIRTIGSAARYVALSR
jgi:hypothetical protein